MRAESALNEPARRPDPPAPAPRLVVTGAGGWIARAVRRAVVAGAAPGDPPGRATPRRFGEVVAWPRAALEAAEAPVGLAGAVVLHLAAIAHRTGVDAAELGRVNRDLAISAARLAREGGARRFVLVSSAAVMGPSSGGRPWVETDIPAPADAYARAKRDAEAGVRRLGAAGGFEVVVARPVLVWGPGVRANFLAMLRAAETRWPLPLGAATAPRSAVYLDNAADALLHLACCPAAVGGTFFVSDTPDRSVAQWISTLRAERGRRPGLLEAPAGWLRLAARLAHRESVWEKLFLPAQADASALRATGWSAPVRPDEALRRTLAWLDHGASDPAAV